MLQETLYYEALKAAEKLVPLNDDALFTELGLRIEDLKNVDGYVRSQQYSADFVHDAEIMGPLDDLKKVGRLWWKNLQPKLMDLICVQNNAEITKLTEGKTLPQIAATLATAGLISTVAPPAWLIVVTSVLANKIAESGLDALCQVWQESLTGK